MNESGLEIEKLIISPEDELVDVLKEIEKSKAQRIILTFAEPSDLLISPINMKVIQDTADEKKKPLISLIVQNPVGVRNAKEAGMTVTETSGSIVDTFWENAEKNMEMRIASKKASLKKTNGKDQKEEVAEVEVFDTNEIANDVEQQRASGTKSEFQKRVEEAIEKSRNGINEKKKIIQENGVVFGLDQEVEQNDEPSLLGKNFKNTPHEENPSEDIPKKGFAMSPMKFPRISLPKNLQGWALKILLPVFLVLGLSAWIAYSTLPLVKVKVFVESKGVSIEKVFAGDLKTVEYSEEKGTVPVKKEEANKSASNSTKATGTGYKGAKAEGVIIIKYYDIIGNPTGVTLKAGTVLTSTSGLKFETTAQSEVKNFINDPVPVRALSVGEEYNLAAGQVFTVEGYTLSQMEASNSSPFEGGSKTPYVILSKADVDKVVNDLKKNLLKEAEEELRSKNDGTWELITDSIKSDLDGEAETDVPIGAEADTVNITVKTKSTALYFQKNSIDQSIAGMLTKAAMDKDLFEGSETDSLVLEENVTKSIEVTEIKKDSIKVKVTASSNIQPNVDKNALIEQLKGKSWDEGIAIINGMKFTDRENTAEFIPDYFPQWLRYFPRKQGRLFIEIEQVTKEQ